MPPRLAGKLAQVAVRRRGRVRENLLIILRGCFCSPFCCHYLYSGTSSIRISSLASSVIGICVGIGADRKKVISVLKNEFESFGFETSTIKVTNYYKMLGMDNNLYEKQDKLSELNAKIDFGVNGCQNPRKYSEHIN